MYGRPSVCLSVAVYLSVRIEKLNYNWTDFHKIRYAITYRKSIE